MGEREEREEEEGGEECELKKDEECEGLGAGVGMATGGRW